MSFYNYFSRYSYWEDVLDGQQSAFSGYVKSEAKLEEVIDAYEYATSSRFCVLKSLNSFGRKQASIEIQVVPVCKHLKVVKYFVELSLQKQNLFT